MAARYEQRIREFCNHEGIRIPAGFGRNSPSRYAVVKTDVQPPKLVALTFFRVSDLLTYLRGQFEASSLGAPADLPVRILDFKEGRELRYDGSARLSPIGPLDPGA